MKLTGYCLNRFDDFAPSGVMINTYWKYQPNVAEQEAILLQAVSDVRSFSAKQWCFVLSSISTLTRETHYFDADEGPARGNLRSIAHILVRLLQAGMFLLYSDDANTYISLWLHVVMSLLDAHHNDSGSNDGGPGLDGRILHARDIKSCGNCNFRDPNCILQLLSLSRDHDLDSSLMSGCLVTILHILIGNGRTNELKVRLVNQYLDIIREERDVITRSVSVPELLAGQYDLPYTLLSWLTGRFVYSIDRREAIRATLLEYDVKLIDADAHPTTSMLNVMDVVLQYPSDVAGLKFQNSWLSLYADNLTHSSHTSAIPVVWSSDCTSIASKRLDLYDKGTVTPELDLVSFLLSSHSPLIVCRALRWYLCLENDALVHGNTRYFVSFPTIFRKGLSADEKRESWLPLAEFLLQNWKDVPLERRSHFVKIFFGCGSSQANNQSTTRESAPSVGVEDETDHSDIETQASIPQSDGLAWMEDVWMTVLRPMVRMITTTHHKSVMRTAYPVSAAPEGRIPLAESRTTTVSEEAPKGVPQGMVFVPRQRDRWGGAPAVPPLKPIEERLEDSAHGILRVLALLLEAGANVMPRTLLNRLEDSCLLSDARLHHDVKSLCRIEAVLRHNQGG